jgi:hypothetical protein
VILGHIHALESPGIPSWQLRRSLLISGALGSRIFLDDIFPIGKNYFTTNLHSVAIESAETEK